MKFWVVAVFCLANICLSRQFSIPFVKPRDYMSGDIVFVVLPAFSTAPIEFYTNKLTSVKTQLTFDYYSYPFCINGKIKTMEKSLGEILNGDVVKTTFYTANAMENVECRSLCNREYDNPTKERFIHAIEDHTNINLIIDGLPVTMVHETITRTKHYHNGIYLGYISDGNRYYLNNHLQFTILYHRNAKNPDSFRIVGAEVVPSSRKLESNGPEVIPWTYSVTWEENPNIEWASRWDHFMRSSRTDGIQWYSIMNSLLIVFFLSAVVAMIMVRVLRKDISKYNSFDKEDAMEETGWKLIHGDVFRTPEYSTLLSVIVGTGVQLLFLAALVILFSLLGFVSVSKRGSIITVSVVFFFILSIVTSYIASRLSKCFGGVHWKRVVFFSVSFLPSIIGSIVLIINGFHRFSGSTQAMPFIVILMLLLMWMGISTPLSFFGAFLGFRSQKVEFPCRTNQIAREIPPQPFYLNKSISYVLSGLIPFGTIYMELHVAFSSLWMNQIVYMFGFMFVIYCILVITCIEISIVITYFRLTNEDYEWWWSSFIGTAQTGTFLYLFSVFYSRRLSLNHLSSIVIYHGYSVLLSIMLAIMTGSIGFLAAFFFVKIIYGSIKVD